MAEEMTSPAKSASGTPRSKRKIDYKPLEVDVKVVELITCHESGNQ